MNNLKIRTGSGHNSALMPKVDLVRVIGNSLVGWVQLRKIFYINWKYFRLHSQCVCYKQGGKIFCLSLWIPQIVLMIDRLCPAQNTNDGNNRAVWHHEWDLSQPISVQYLVTWPGSDQWEGRKGVWKNCVLDVLSNDHTWLGFFLTSPAWKWRKILQGSLKIFHISIYLSIY